METNMALQMISRLADPARRRRLWCVPRACLVLAVAFAAAGCSPDEILSVEDPDTINPEDVRSSAGANAVRVGALARFRMATTASSSPTGGESLLMLGGLFADEWNNGDSFIARQEVDQRVITAENTFLTDANRQLHRSRLSAEQAVALLTEFSPNAPRWHVAEMHFIQAYAINILAEHYCDGLTFSSVEAGREVYGDPMTTQQAYERALEQANAGIALITGTSADDLRVLNALRSTRGRILLNLNRPADAAAAVAAVPTSYQYVHRHAIATGENNQYWSLNTNSRRYSVSDNEGGNGFNFATAGDPRVPVCRGGQAGCITQANRDDLTQPLFVQRLWLTRETDVALIRGVDSRMIEAEAQLRANSFGNALAIMNTARTTVTGLAPLVDPGTDAARINMLFRERAFWQFGRGYRTGDMRRLVRQYSRAPETVFPTGAWHKGGTYGVDVTIPVPFAELNNPKVTGPSTCLARGA
jgi:starch-binding outer membrane protein, SusD/RagB family